MTVALPEQKPLINLGLVKWHIVAGIAFLIIAMLPPHVEKGVQTRAPHREIEIGQIVIVENASVYLRRAGRDRNRPAVVKLTQVGIGGIG